MKIRITLDLDPDALVTDVQSFLASVRFVLKGFFPSARMNVLIEDSCKPAKAGSTNPRIPSS